MSADALQNIAHTLAAPEMLLAFAVALAAGLLRGFAGFGSAMLMSPVFAILFGPQVMVPVIVLMELLISVQLLPPAMRECQWRFVAPMSLAAALAMPFGAWALVSLEAGIISRAVAAMVALFAAVLMLGWRHRGRKRLAVAVPVATLSGAMMATTSVGGPPVLLYMLSGGDRAAVNRANIVAYYGATQVALLAVLAAAGLVTGPVLVQGLVLFPLMAAGAVIGARLFRAADETIYRRVALAVLLAVGLYGLVR